MEVASMVCCRTVLESIQPANHRSYIFAMAQPTLKLKLLDLSVPLHLVSLTLRLGMFCTCVTTGCYPNWQCMAYYFTQSTNLAKARIISV